MPEPGIFVSMLTKMLLRLREFALSLAVTVMFLGGFFLLICLIVSWFEPSVKPAAIPTWLLYAGAPFGAWHLWLMGPGLPSAIAAIEETDKASTDNVSKDQE